MFLYNVTIKIDDSVREEWLDWMKKTHIPEVMDTGLFTSNRICRLLENEEEGGATYAIQYTFKDLDDYTRYREIFAPSLQEKHLQKYRNKFVAFRTLLEIIE